jgi:hypothetical protein
MPPLPTLLALLIAFICVTTITCREDMVTPVPITPAVIIRAHTIAEQEKMPEGLKIAYQTGQLLYYSAWIARVGYDQEAFEDQFDKTTTTAETTMIITMTTLVIKLMILAQTKITDVDIGNLED